MRDGRGHRILAPSALGIVLLGVVAYMAIGCSTRLVEGDGYEGIVFKPAAAERALGSMLRGEDATYWAPSNRDIAALERALAVYVARSAPGGLALAEYHRQYFGFTRDGDRRVYVVGFCDDDPAARNWRHEFVPLGEAQLCHFEAEYDLATGRVVRYWTIE